MVCGYIYVNNKALVFGRFVKQIKEFKKKTGVDEIRLAEDKNKGKEDFLTCGAFGNPEAVVACLDLMKNEAGCRRSVVGIVLSIGMTVMIIIIIESHRHDAGKRQHEDLTDAGGCWISHQGG